MGSWLPSRAPLVHLDGFSKPVFGLKGLCLGEEPRRRFKKARLRIFNLYNADGKRFLRQVLKREEKGCVEKWDECFPITSSEVLRRPLQDKLFPLEFSPRAVLREESRRLSCLVPVVLDQSRAATAFCVGSFPPGQTDKFGDFNLFIKGCFTARGRAFPPGSILTQSVFQRVHHHLVDQQVSLIGSEGGGDARTMSSFFWSSTEQL